MACGFTILVISPFCVDSPSFLLDFREILVKFVAFSFQRPFSLKSSVAQQQTHDKVSSILRRHGAVRVNTSLLLPKHGTEMDNIDAAVFVDNGGTIVTLPYNLRVRRNFVIFFWVFYFLFYQVKLSDQFFGLRRPVGKRAWYRGVNLLHALAAFDCWVAFRQTKVWKRRPPTLYSNAVGCVSNSCLNFNWRDSSDRIHDSSFAHILPCRSARPPIICHPPLTSTINGLVRRRFLLWGLYHTVELRRSRGTRSRKSTGRGRSNSLVRKRCGSAPST